MKHNTRRGSGAPVFLVGFDSLNDNGTISMSKHIRLALVIVALAVPAAVAIALAVQQRGAAQTEHEPKDDLSREQAQRPSDTASAARAAARAVMSKKAALAEACWTPLLAQQGEPAQSHHLLRETFDSEGKEVSRTVEDVNGQSRADVAECLRALPLDFEIAPGDQPLTVTVTIAFP